MFSAMGTTQVYEANQRISGWPQLVPEYLGFEKSDNLTLQCSIANQSTEEIDKSFVVHLNESNILISVPSSPSGRVVSADQEQVFRTFVAALQNKFLQIRGAGPIGVVTVVWMVAATPRAAPSPSPSHLPTWPRDAPIGRWRGRGLHAPCRHSLIYFGKNNIPLRKSIPFPAIGLSDKIVKYLHPSSPFTTTKTQNNDSLSHKVYLANLTFVYFERHLGNITPIQIHVLCPSLLSVLVPAVSARPPLLAHLPLLFLLLLLLFLLLLLLLLLLRLWLFVF